MLRLSTPSHQRFNQAQHLEVTFGGAEANVAVTVAQLGGSSGFVTRLPANPLGDRAVTELQRLGVEVAEAQRGGSRIGTYFVEHGTSLRSSKVIYDRAGSAFAESDAASYQWNRILEGARWFHWTGISPALSTGVQNSCLAATKEAREKGCTVSFDVNHRSILWSTEEAATVLQSMMQNVDLCITSAQEGMTIFGLDGEATDERSIAAALCERYDFAGVAFTSRKATDAHETDWGASLFWKGELYSSRRYSVQIVDRLGAGDSFSGALILSLLEGRPPQQAVEFAAAASALKHTIYGDFFQATRSEVEEIAAGGRGGRVQR